MFLPAYPSDYHPRIVQLKITLQGIEPLVWRRILIPDDLTLGRLHDVIQVAMGWEDGHMHAFHIGDRQYGIPDDEFAGPDFKIYQERNVKVSGVIDRKFTRFMYEYDFGDGWRHELLVEGFHEFDRQLTYPRYVDGARRCPPEDVGGIGGYADFLEAIMDPLHPEHDEMRDWFGGEFNPDALDAKAIEIGLMTIAYRRRPGKKGQSKQDEVQV
ncbi:MAG: plasmid pRiA4b ORF-3 family protein [Magnetococcales bacterium]|nr:plasmid pRiA4b ORF-3 family protein [Magnetococcales bacterium]